MSSEESDSDGLVIDEDDEQMEGIEHVDVDQSDDPKGKDDSVGGDEDMSVDIDPEVDKALQPQGLPSVPPAIPLFDSSGSTGRPALVRNVKSKHMKKIVHTKTVNPIAGRSRRLDEDVLSVVEDLLEEVDLSTSRHWEDDSTQEEEELELEDIGVQKEKKTPEDKGAKGWVPYDPSTPHNKMRAMLEGIVNRLKQQPEAAESEDIEQIIDPIPQYRLRPGYSFARDGRGLISKLNKLNNDRLGIVEYHDKLKRARRCNNPLQREVIKNPELATTEQARQRLILTRQIPNTKPLPDPMYPVKKAGQTFFPPSFGFSGTVVSRQPIKKKQVLAKTDSNLKGSRALGLNVIGLERSRPQDLNLAGLSSSKAEKRKRQDPPSPNSPTQPDPIRSQPKPPPSFHEDGIDDDDVDDPQVVVLPSPPISPVKNTDQSTQLLDNELNQPDQDSDVPQYLHVTGLVRQPSVCDRAGVYECLMTTMTDYFNRTEGDCLIRGERDIEQPNESELMIRPNYLIPSLLPCNRLVLYNYYNRHDEDPSVTEVAAVTSLTAKLCRALLAVGIEAGVATENEMESTVGSSKFWHGEYIQRYMNNLLAAYKFGIIIPNYQSPPKKWLDRNYRMELDATLHRELIFIDEKYFPPNFPLVSSLSYMKNRPRGGKLATILGTDIFWYDLERFLPYDRYKLTYNAMEASIKLILHGRDKKPGQTSDLRRGLTYYKPNLELYDQFKKVDQDIDKAVKENNKAERAKLMAEKHRLRKEMDDLKEKIATDAVRNDLVIILSFTQWQQRESMEIIVVANHLTGEIKLFGSDHPKTNYEKYHPIKGMRQSYNLEKSLYVQLNKLRDYLVEVLSRKNFQKRGWIIKGFSSSTTIDKLKQDDMVNGRLILVKFVDRLTQFPVHKLANAEEGYTAWKVGKPRPPQFKSTTNATSSDLTLEQELSRYNENYLSNLYVNEYRCIPNSIVDGLFQKDTFYELGKAYLKLRYFDLIRNWINVGFAALRH